jgi:alginate O-acetyltransferase complex protein AlgI
MPLTQTLVFAGLAVLIGLVTKNRARGPLLLLISILSVYWLSPALTIRYLDFWLPTLTLALTAVSWALTAPPDLRTFPGNWGAILMLFTVVLALGGVRYLAEPLILASRPPASVQVFLAAMLTSLFVIAAHRFWRPLAVTAMIVLLIAILVVLKTPALSAGLSALLRTANHQSEALATPLDLRWLGFSYIAFRLIHTLRDRQAGRLPPVNMGEYFTYVIFFPSLTAGPIDRIERFVKDLRQPSDLAAPDWLQSGRRFFVGMFKKYVVADMLALIAMSAKDASQVHSAGWAWLLLYAFALQIYFDFSGYTDIAIGIAIPLGVRLPENFNAPYLKPNLTQFWNNWHMTLTQWFRSYYFNPLTRSMRTAKRPLPGWAMILLSQTTTMVLIGLWHGITLNFALWGLWHGLGLFVHNRWSEFLKRLGSPHWLSQAAGSSVGMTGLLRWGGIALTFNYVALGWVFFALPTPQAARHFFSILLGLG